MPTSEAAEGDTGSVGAGRLRAARLAAGLTLRQTADALEVSPATWSAIEKGHTKVGAERLANASRLFGTELGGPPMPSRMPDWRTFEPLVLPPPLAAALAAFVEFGYHGASIRTIADRAGLSVAGLYHYHATKQELLAELHEITMTDLLQRAHAAVGEGTDPISRFKYLVECLSLFHTYRLGLSFIGASEMHSLQSENLARVVRSRQEVQHLIDVQIIEGCRTGVMTTNLPREAGRAVAVMCTGIARWWSARGPYSPEDVAAQYVGFALNLVGAASGT